MCRLIKCSWYYSWLTQIRTPPPISFFCLYLPLQSCCTQGGDLSQGQLTVINTVSHRGPNNESPSLGFGLSIMHLWQFLESQWFALAPVPSSVSFGCCFLHNVSWLDSLLSWGSSRKDSETSEWRCMSAVFPTVVKTCLTKAAKGRKRLPWLTVLGYTVHHGGKTWQSTGRSKLRPHSGAVGD